MKDNALKIRNTSLILAVIAAFLALARVILPSLMTTNLKAENIIGAFSDIEPSLIFIVILLVFHKNGRVLSWMPLVYLMYFLNFVWNHILIYKNFKNSFSSQNVSFFSYAYVNMFNFALFFLPAFLCLIAAVLAFFNKNPKVVLVLVIVYYVLYFIILIPQAFSLLTPPDYMTREMFLQVDVRPIVHAFFDFTSNILAFTAYVYYTVKTLKMNSDTVAE